MPIAQFNRFEIEMSDQAVAACHHSGDCDFDVQFWAPLLSAKRDMIRCSPDELRIELDEYGAWTDEELSSDEDNWHRIIWIAACDIQEEQFTNNKEQR